MCERSVMDTESGVVGTSPEILLCGCFTQAPSHRDVYTLALTTSELRVQLLESPSRAPAALQLADCLGSRAFRGLSTDPGGHYFSVTAYPTLERRGRRREVSWTFRVGASPDPEEDRRTAETWAASICQLATPVVPGQAGGALRVLPRPSQLLIFLNPRGGKGTAYSLFTTHVLPMLSKADIGFNLVVTERPNHARELAHDYALERWDALVVVSGDGLMYEVVNGLMERPDWSSAIKKPLCILPAGSGNALAASVNHYSGQKQVTNPELLVNCTFHLCKGLVSPMDLVSITTSSGKRIFSFLSVAWGFVSDVDIESEKYRMLGAMRFSIGTAIRLAALRIYKGRLAYLPAEEPSASVSARTPDQLIPAAAKGEITSTPVQSHQYTPYNFCNSNNVETLEGNEEHRSSQSRSGSPGLLDSLLVPLDQPVPTTWKVVKEDKFVMVLALYQSHLGADLFSAPMVTSLNDHLIQLFYISAGISRASLIKIFVAMEKGTHMEYDCPYFVHMPVKAFRIEPFGSRDIMTVDGEVIECESLQGQVHSGLGRLISGGR
ncbi:sphingosine kinase 1 [Ambystoma mexicanum]|uniref:sphingosine kinase 1 n=1 Tax=Ambystoma mexicanum TaxID=8296 RepID=UPI0037E8B205